MRLTMRLRKQKIWPSLLAGLTLLLSGLSAAPAMAQFAAGAPPSSLKAYYEAQYIAGSPASGATISNAPGWNSVVVTNTTLTGTLGGVYTTGVINGKPVVRFSGASNARGLQGTLAAALAQGGTGLHYFVVFKNGNGGGFLQDTTQTGSGAPSGAANRVALAATSMYAGGAGVASFTGVPALDANAHWLEYTLAGVTSNVKVDGAATTYTVASDPGSNAIGAINLAGATSVQWSGDIALVMVLDNTATAADLTNVRAYIASTYFAASATFTVSPTAVGASSTGNVITLVGTGTAWVNGTTVFTVGGNGTKTAQTVTDATHANVTITAGATVAANNITITDGAASNTVTTNAALSFTAMPSSLPQNHAANITLTLVGSGTSWVGGTTVFSISGVTGWAKVSQTVSSGTSATVILSAPAAASPPTGATGTLVLTDGSLTQNLTISAATLSVAPVSGLSSAGVTAITFGASDPLIASDGAVITASVLGGTTYTANSGTWSGSGPFTATASLNIGSATGSILFTEPQTGAQATFTVNAAPVTNYVRYIGDSITAGYNGTADWTGFPSGNDYPSQAMQILGATRWTGSNGGVDGVGLSFFNSSQYTPLSASGYNASIGSFYSTSHPVNVLVITGGTNDLTQATAGIVNSTYGLMVLMGQAAKAQGWKVVVQTVLPRNGVSGGAGNAGFETNRQAFNTLVRANWRAFADALCDWGNDGRIGQPGQYANTTYFLSDVTHFTIPGYGVLGQYSAAATLQAATSSAGGAAIIIRPGSHTTPRGRN